MKQVVCALRDSAVGSYMRPTFAPTPAAIVRSLSDEVNKKDTNPLSAHPEDYELFQLAVFDDETGVFEDVEITSIVRCKDLVRG